MQPCWDRHDRISAISAITLAPDQPLDLCFTLLADNENAHGRDTIRFLEQLQIQCPGPLTIVWDRGNIHDRCAEVRDYLALHPEIVTEKFPAYAPELNPQELVWSYTKYGRMSNFAPKNTFWEKGLFAVQHTACRLRNQFTLERLTKHFQLDE